MANDTDQTPEHRRGFPTRSGDTHVIGGDGELHNVDAEQRETNDVEFVGETFDEPMAGAGEAVQLPGGDLPPIDAGTVLAGLIDQDPSSPDGGADPLPSANPLDHDGDGRKGGMRGVAAKKTPSTSERN